MSIFLNILFSSLIVVVIGFSQNPRPYIENGKLNSPMTATFISANGQYIPNQEQQMNITPRPSLLQMLSPHQYVDRTDEPSFPQQNSRIHNIQLYRQDPQSRLPYTQLNTNLLLGSVTKYDKNFARKPYNDKYPFTPPVIKYKIGVISDMDKNSTTVNPSKSDPPKMWGSYLKEGTLSIQFNPRNPELSKVSAEWVKDSAHKILSGYNYVGRGMELSTLNIFNGRIITCDDKTGIVFELPSISNRSQIDPVPWAILADGNSTSPTGFKCEWATVKDEHLWIGGHGTSEERTDTNSTLNNNYKFVKKISAEGEVTHLDWRSHFDKMAQALDIKYPGYVTHEAVGWSDILQKWVFMPRHVSKVKFTSDAVVKPGSNVVLLADEQFDNINVIRVGSPNHGFSGFKWIPGTRDQIVVAIKTLENKKNGTTESYITAFTLEGTVLLKETKFADQKFEGIEFI